MVYWAEKAGHKKRKPFSLLKLWELSPIRRVNLKKLINRYNNIDKACIIPVIDSELDEQWSFVGNKKQQRWLWLAIQHNTSEILAYTFGDRSGATMEKLKKLLRPFGINKFYTDHFVTYFRKLANHIPGKRNTQKIERKFLTFRTRIKRLAKKTICFSKTEFMHDLKSFFINKVSLFLKYYDIYFPYFTLE